MRRLRRSGLPSCLLALVMSLAVLLPEAGHSLAHRHASEALLHHEVAHADAHGHGAVATVGDDHLGDDHPHFDLVAILTGKPLLAFAVAAATVRFATDLGSDRHIVAATLPDTVPRAREHGPPPPSRAPPLT